MSDLQAIADRFEIEALRGEFTDASMTRDWDRFASLFTQDGAWRMSHINEELVGREEIRAGVERLRGLWDFFVQNAHPGTIQLEVGTAVGRAYVAEFGRFRDGRSNLNYSIYHDRYQRTPGGWKFAERAYEVRYLDTTPLSGSAPDPAGGASPRPDPPIPTRPPAHSCVRLDVQRRTVGALGAVALGDVRDARGGVMAAPGLVEWSLGDRQERHARPENVVWLLPTGRSPPGGRRA